MHHWPTRNADVREDPCRSQLHPVPAATGRARRAWSRRPPFVSVVRDLQQAVAAAGRAPANAASLSAKADVQSVSGRPDQAVVSLIAAGALR